MSDEFISNYLPNIIDLGRAFIRPDFQTKNNKQNIFILDNIWDGLGALVDKNVKYFLGRIILYPNLKQEIRDLIIYFMDKHFNKKSALLQAKKPFYPKSKQSLLMTNTYMSSQKTLHILKEQSS